MERKKEEEFKKNLDEFWSENKQKLLEARNIKNDPIQELKKSKNNNEINKSSIIKLNYYKKKNYSPNKNNLQVSQSNENFLPKIPLFNEEEKKILKNVLPQKEIEKYEKRYESLESSKNNLQKKYKLETQKLEKENKDLEKRYDYSTNQLRENEKKNNDLIKQINKQKKEINDLQKKLFEIVKTLEDHKIKVRERDNENKRLVKQLEELQDKYEKVDNPEEENEEEEEEEKEHVEN